MSEEKNNEKNKKKKKPLVVFDNQKHGRSDYYQPQFTKQNILLKGLVISGGDVNAARKMAGIRTMAETYRVLDRLSMRKEYQMALSRAGIDFDWIVSGIKGLAQDSKLDSVRLRALTTLMQSLGVANYEKDESSGKDWEKLLLDTYEKNEDENPSGVEQKILEAPEEEEYEVNVPKVPDSAKKIRQEEEQLGKDLYDD